MVVIERVSATAGRVMRSLHSLGAAERGGAALELALVTPFFLMLILGVIDFGRAAMMTGMVSMAAREGARAAITRVSYDTAAASPAATPKTVTGSAATVIADTARALTAGLESPLTVSTVAALEPDGGTTSGAYVRVTVTGTYNPVVGAFLKVGSIPISASSKVYLQ